jgi:hypothetical protein
VQRFCIKAESKTLQASKQWQALYQQLTLFWRDLGKEDAVHRRRLYFKTINNCPETIRSVVGPAIKLEQIELFQESTRPDEVTQHIDVLRE